MYYKPSYWGYDYPRSRYTPSALDRFYGDGFAPKSKRYHAQESGYNHSTSGRCKPTKRYADGRQKGKRK